MAMASLLPFLRISPRSITSLRGTSASTFASPWKRPFSQRNKLHFSTQHPIPIPPKSWDTHMHAVDPKHFPISPDAVYTPSTHTAQDVTNFLDANSIQKSILVQPSIYGSDNSCLLACLTKLSGRSRGVVVVNPGEVDEAVLRDWDDLGVRGVRINLKSQEKAMTETELEETLLRHASLIKRLNWFIDLHIPLHIAPMLEPIVPMLDVNVCIDHFGCPDIPTIAWDKGDTLDPYDLHGFLYFIHLLEGKNTFVKMSAPYRMSKDPEMRDIRSIATELLRQAPDQAIYASDWPHTRFEGYDVAPFTRMIRELCGSDAGLAERIFRSNTERLLQESSLT